MTQSANNLLIHVGYAKAGSTWLQSCFKDSKSGFLGLGRDQKYFPGDDFVLANALTFDASPYKASLKKHMEKSKSQNLVSVLTSERLAGNWFSGGYDAKEIADRLYESAPDGKVLIVFREQVKMLTSVYRQYIKKGGGRSLKDLFFPPERGRTRTPGFSFEHFNYDLVIRYYQEKFGEKNVLALPLEFIGEAPESAFKLIQDFAGVSTSERFRINPEKKNVGISSVEASIKRRLNIFLCADSINDYSVMHNRVTKLLANVIYKGLSLLLSKKMKKDSNLKLAKAIEGYVNDQYRESNVRTSELIKMDLSKYGYMS